MFVLQPAVRLPKGWGKGKSPPLFSGVSLEKAEGFG